MARKPGLGKGLGALIPDGGTSGTTSPDQSAPPGGPLRKVPVSSIRPNKFQPRKTFDADGLKALAASVRELGVLQPIIVRAIASEPGTYELIAG